MGQFSKGLSVISASNWDPPNLGSWPWAVFTPSHNSFGQGNSCFQRKLWGVLFRRRGSAADLPWISVVHSIKAEVHGDDRRHVGCTDAAPTTVSTCREPGYLIVRHVTTNHRVSQQITQLKDCGGWTKSRHLSLKKTRLGMNSQENVEVKAREAQLYRLFIYIDFEWV